MRAGLFDEPPQILDGQNISGAAMDHAVAVGAERTQVGHGINHTLAADGKRIQVMHLDVGMGVCRAVERIEVETARHARRAVRTYRSGTIVWITFVSSALPKNLTAFGVAALAFNTMSRVFRFNVCPCLGFDVRGQTLKTKLKSTGATFMASASGLRLLQCAKNI